MYTVTIRPIEPTKKSKNLKLDFFGPLDNEVIRNWQKIANLDSRQTYELNDQWKSIQLIREEK